jgi:hypothetical protein
MQVRLGVDQRLEFTHFEARQSSVVALEKGGLSCALELDSLGAQYAENNFVLRILIGLVQTKLDKILEALALKC